MTGNSPSELKIKQIVIVIQKVKQGLHEISLVKKPLFFKVRYSKYVILGLSNL